MSDKRPLLGSGNSETPEAGAQFDAVVQSELNSRLTAVLGREPNENETQLAINTMLEAHRAWFATQNPIYRVPAQPLVNYEDGKPVYSNQQKEKDKPDNRYNLVPSHLIEQILYGNVIDATTFADTFMEGLVNENNSYLEHFDYTKVSQLGQKDIDNWINAIKTNVLWGNFGWVNVALTLESKFVTEGESGERVPDTQKLKKVYEQAKHLQKTEKIMKMDDLDPLTIELMCTAHTNYRNGRKQPDGQRVEVGSYDDLIKNAVRIEELNNIAQQLYISAYRSSSVSSFLEENIYMNNELNGVESLMIMDLILQLAKTDISSGHPNNAGTLGLHYYQEKVNQLSKLIASDANPVVILAIARNLGVDLSQIES